MFLRYFNLGFIFGFGYLSIIFKMIVAIIDTPLLYLLVGLIRKKFHLGINDEIEID